MRLGENRVVVGAHWQSDTEAARMAAAVAYAKLHTSERFLEQMKKAREEYKLITSDPAAIRGVAACSHHHRRELEISRKCMAIEE